MSIGYCEISKILSELRVKLQALGMPLCVCMAEGNEDLIWNAKGLTILKDVSVIGQLLSLMEGGVRISNVVVFVTPGHWNVAIREADVAIMPYYWEDFPEHSVRVLKWRVPSEFNHHTLRIDDFVKNFTNYNID